MRHCLALNYPCHPCLLLLHLVRNVDTSVSLRRSFTQHAYPCYCGNKCQPETPTVPSPLPRHPVMASWITGHCTTGYNTYKSHCPFKLPGPPLAPVITGDYFRVRIKGGFFLFLFFCRNMLFRNILDSYACPSHLSWPPNPGNPWKPWNPLKGPQSSLTVAAAE